MRQALVTGAAGFIGSHPCEALLRGGDAVTVLDASTDCHDPRQQRAHIGTLPGTPGFEPIHAGSWGYEAGAAVPAAAKGPP